MYSVVVESVSVRAGGRVLEFQRLLNASQQDVWAALTEPDKLRQWYAQPEADAANSKTVRLRFANTDTTVETTVTRLVSGAGKREFVRDGGGGEKPLVLEYTWEAQSSANARTSVASLDGSVVRFELQPQGTGTLLTLYHIFQSDDTPVADVIGGWQTHLDELVNKLHNGFAPQGARIDLKKVANGTCGGRIREYEKVINVAAKFGSPAGRAENSGAGTKAPYAEEI